MTAKDIQTEFIKTYLKPTLKRFGYLSSGQTWWKNKGDFIILINLQNYSWNSEDKVDFCFNIGINLTAVMKDSEIKKPKAVGMTVYLRENSYLPDNRQEHKFKNKVGYSLIDNTNLNELITELKIDFENEILPRLDKLKSLKDCLEFYNGITFWSDNLKRVISENKLLIN